MAIPMATLNMPWLFYLESNFVSRSIRADSQSAIRHLQIPGRQAALYEQALLGWSEYDGAGKLIRYPPEPYPGRPWLVARSVDFIRELDVFSQTGPSGLIEFISEEVAVQYEAVPGVSWLRDEQKPAGATSEVYRFFLRRMEYEAHNRPFPKASLKWKADDSDILEPAGQLEFEATCYYTLFQIPAVVDANNAPFLPAAMWANIHAAVFHMNDAPFDGFAKWTALPIAPKLELVQMTSGRPAFNVTYPILIRGGPDVSGAPLAGTETADWTRLLRGDGLYWRAYRKSDSVAKAKGIYPEASLSKLFQTT